METINLATRHVGEAPTAIAIGAFDGVHRGHRELLARLNELSAARGLRSGILTFDRHPASVVRPDSAPRLLCDNEQKMELLATTGIDFVAVLPFDERASLESASEFVHRVIGEELNSKLVVVGADFHFGNGRKGNVALLHSLGSEMGFDTLGLALVPDAETSDVISSTRIRTLLAEGRVEQANAMLGREHEIRGVVVHGDARGRTLGFPTANVMVPGSVALPSDGVYAGWYTRPNGDIWPTAISVGRRPTFYEENGALLVEAHLIDFDGDLYDEHAHVRFSHWIRGQVKFGGVDELVTQLHIDIADCKKYSTK